MRPRHVVLVGCLAVAGCLAIFGDKTPASNVAEPVVRAGSSPLIVQQTPPKIALTSDNQPKATVDILALRTRAELIGGAHAGVASAALFTSQNWNPPPPPPQKPAPSPPTAPPLPFTYLGKKIEDGIWEVYVARGDQTYILRENSVIDGTYRVDAIKPPTLTLTYMPLQQVQTLPVGGTE